MDSTTNHKAMTTRTLKRRKRPDEDLPFCLVQALTNQRRRVDTPEEPSISKIVIIDQTVAPITSRRVCCNRSDFTTNDSSESVCTHCGTVGEVLLTSMVKYDEGVELKRFNPMKDEKVLQASCGFEVDNKNAVTLLTQPHIKKRIKTDAAILCDTKNEKRQQNEDAANRANQLMKTNVIEQLDQTQTPSTMKHAMGRVNQVVSSVIELATKMVDSHHLYVTDPGQPVECAGSTSECTAQYMDRLRTVAHQCVMSYESNRTTETMRNAIVSGVLYMHARLLQLDNDAKFAAFCGIIAREYSPTELKNLELQVVKHIRRQASKVRQPVLTSKTPRVKVKPEKKEEQDEDQSEEEEEEQDGSDSDAEEEQEDDSGSDRDVDVEQPPQKKKNKKQGNEIVMKLKQQRLDYKLNKTKIDYERGKKRYEQKQMKKEEQRKISAAPTKSGAYLVTHAVVFDTSAIPYTRDDYEVLRYATKSGDQVPVVAAKRVEMDESDVSTVMMMETDVKIDQEKLDLLEEQQQRIFAFYLKPEYRASSERMKYIKQHYPPTSERLNYCTPAGYLQEFYDVSYIRSVIAMAHVTKRNVKEVQDQFHRHYTTKCRADAKKSEVARFTIEGVAGVDGRHKSFVTRAYDTARIEAEQWLMAMQRVDGMDRTESLNNALQFALQSVKMGVLYNASYLAALTLYHITSRIWASVIDRHALIRLVVKQPTAVPDEEFFYTNTLIQKAFNNALKSFSERVETPPIDVDLVWTKALHYALYLRTLMTFRESHARCATRLDQCKCYGHWADANEQKYLAETDARRIRLQHRLLKAHPMVRQYVNKGIIKAYSTYTSDTKFRRYNYRILAHVVVFFALQFRRVAAAKVLKRPVHPENVLKSTFGGPSLNTSVRSLMSGIEKTIQQDGNIHDVILRCKVDINYYQMLLSNEQ